MLLLIPWLIACTDAPPGTTGPTDGATATGDTGDSGGDTRSSDSGDADTGAPSSCTTDGLVDGFYWHTEVDDDASLFRACHWPGFDSGDAYDERTVLRTTSVPGGTTLLRVRVQDHGGKIWNPQLSEVTLTWE